MQHDLGRKEGSFVGQAESMHQRRTFMKFHLSLVPLMAMACLLTNQSFGQIQVQWPEDVLNGSCDSNISDFTEVPAVLLDSTCTAYEVTSEDVFLEGNCSQEIWIDREWTIAACEDTMRHVQSIRLRDLSPPFIANAIEQNGHYCESSLDWLPVVQDNCDNSLQGQFVLSDSISLCQGVLSLVIALDVSDNCGNVLDTSYHVFLHDEAPPEFDDYESSVMLACADTSDLNSITFEDCGGLAYEFSEVAGPSICQGLWLNRAFSLTDACGVTTTGFQEVEVADTLAPEVLNFSDTIVVQYQSGQPQGASALPEPMLELVDNCDPSPIWTSEDSLEMSSLDSEQWERTFAATDSCGNHVMMTQVIVVFIRVDGCTDSVACNYSSQANEDDGSCLYPEPYQNCAGDFLPFTVCGEGTFFDEVTGTCLPSEDCGPGEESCGPFTVWSSELQLCIPATVSAACYFDSDQNGTVGISDLLNLLSAFGEACE